MQYKVWNKKESINGVSATEITKSFGSGTLLLFYNVENVIERIEDVNILRSVYNLPVDEYPTDASVAEGYLAKLAEQEEAAKASESQLDRIEANLDYIVMGME